MIRGICLLGALLLPQLLPLMGGAEPTDSSELYFAIVNATNKEQRTAVANTGLSIERVAEDYVTVMGHKAAIDELERKGWVQEYFSLEPQMLDYPKKDEKFHNYQELMMKLDQLQSRYSDIIKVEKVGESVEGRQIMNITITHGTTAGKPEILFVGGHHAREHLSVELPLMLAEYLAEQYKAGDSDVVRMVNNRVIHIMPLVNPDGAEYDIEDGEYRMWRKNRRMNKGGAVGVDLNRNYGYKFGTVGASDNPASQTYHGPEAFSEPETQAIRDFVENRPQLTILLSFHTFSELILYPWGHTFSKVANQTDHRVFETMAQRMAQWNGYTPQQSSDLYRTSGDTSDWAYGVHGIFSFTFELDPKSMWDGGFYPGQSYIDRVFDKNLKPSLYLIDLADNPYRVLEPAHRSYGLNSPLIQ